MSRWGFCLRTQYWISSSVFQNRLVGQCAFGVMWKAHEWKLWHLWSLKIFWHALYKGFILDGLAKFHNGVKFSIGLECFTCYKKTLHTVRYRYPKLTCKYQHIMITLTSHPEYWTRTNIFKLNIINRFRNRSLRETVGRRIHHTEEYQLSFK